MAIDCALCATTCRDWQGSRGSNPPDIAENGAEAMRPGRANPRSPGGGAPCPAWDCVPVDDVAEAEAEDDAALDAVAEDVDALVVCAVLPVGGPS